MHPQLRTAPKTLAGQEWRAGRLRLNNYVRAWLVAHSYALFMRFSQRYYILAGGQKPPRHYVTLLCASRSGSEAQVCTGTCWHSCQSLQIAYYKSPERPVGLASRLAFGDPPVQISLGCRKVMSLREDDEVKHVLRRLLPPRFRR